jgi:predicted metal-binding membrane protein
MVVVRRLSREQIVVLLSLIGIMLLAWLYLIDMARGMSAQEPGMPDMAMPPGMGWLVAATMWTVMMIGMMLPAATPMILLYATVQRKQGRRPLLMTAVFVAGYLLLWAGFAIAGAGLQLALADRAQLTPGLTLVSVRVTGAAFLLAAFYEFSPLKNRCLEHCRGPLTFITRHWRPGISGAFRMGVTHGAYCLGCCWALMLLLFAAGVMNLAWVAALSVLVLLQKVLPGGRAVPTATGGAMLVTALVLLMR